MLSGALELVLASMTLAWGEGRGEKQLRLLALASPLPQTSVHHHTACANVLGFVCLSVCLCVQVHMCEHACTRMCTLHVRGQLQCCFLGAGAVHFIFRKGLSLFYVYVCFIACMYGPCVFTVLGEARRRYCVL